MRNQSVAVPRPAAAGSHADVERSVAGEAALRSALTRLAGLAGRIFDAPIAVIRLAGGDTVVFRQAGADAIDFGQIPEHASFFLHAVAGANVLVVPDTAADPRFAADPLFASCPVRFLAGAALIDSAGQVIGTLTVADVRPHRDENEVTVDGAGAAGARAALTDIAALIVQQFEIGRLQRIEDEARRAEAALHDSECQFRLLVNGVTNCALYMLSPDGTITAWNAGAERIKGYTSEEIVGRNFAQFYTYEDQVAGVPANNLRLAVEKGRFEANGWRVRKDGTLIWANVMIEPIYDDGGSRLIGFAKITRDITERREYEEKLHRLAHFDVLTDLPNRFALKSKLEEVIGSAAAVTVFMMDLDGFKIINDSLGHPTGDFVLKAAGERIQNRLGGRGTVGRIGGDEFAAVIPHLADPLIAGALCGAMINAFRAPFSTADEDQDLYVGLSIGVAISPLHGTTADQLLANADLALYQAKTEGMYGYRLFQPSMRQAVIARGSCEAELRRAVRQGELELYYQPKTLLADGAMVGAEALLRWHHPERGLLAPKAFIDVLEHSALAPIVGDWAIQTACRHAALVRAMGLPDFRIAVNLFGAQFRTGGLMTAVKTALRDADLAPELEITEKIIWQHDDGMASQLRELRALGVHVGLDDFGTGYASLILLKRFPLTGLKIDQSFVREMCDDTESAAVVQAVLYLAYCFNLNVTAEGIETDAQEIILRALGCVMGQGYRYGRPMPFHELQAVLADRTKRIGPQVDEAETA